MPYELKAWTGEPVSQKKLAIMNRMRTRMSRTPTPQEKRFQQALCWFCRKGTPLTFTPQKVVHVHAEQAFVMDFYFKQFKLGVEIDGSHHAQRKIEDQWRSDVLATHGIEIMRFHNDEIEGDVAIPVRKVYRKLCDIAYLTQHKSKADALAEAAKRQPWLLE